MPPPVACPNPVTKGDASMATRKKKSERDLEKGYEEIEFQIKWNTP
jgi:hypothetical protein